MSHGAKASQRASGSLCTALLACAVASTSGTARAADPPLGDTLRAVISLEARSQELEGLLEQDEQVMLTSQMRRAFESWQEDPAQAVALFTLMLGYSSGRDQNVVLLERARAEAKLGDRSAAMAHFSEVVRRATARHLVVAAFEGFVAAAESAAGLGEPPPIERYLEAVAPAGEPDDDAWETTYRFGLLLLRRSDRRALEVLARIPDASSAGRRASYLRGVVALQNGDAALAATAFLAAAKAPRDSNDPEAEARDAAVRDLAWLAVGRLAFERGDAVGGLFAYQQIATNSPHFAEAFLELGWMAMDAGLESTALSAFEPLAVVTGDSEIAWRAELVKGLLMVKRGDYVGADRHYAATTQRFERMLAKFDAAVAEVPDVAALARSCETRAWALRDPHLGPVLARPEAQAAWRMSQELEQLDAMALAIDRQVSGIDAMLSLEDPHSPLVKLRSDRALVEQALAEIRRVARHQEEDATRRGWSAGPASVPCCNEARARARHVQQRLERLLEEITERETKLVANLQEMRRGLVALRAEQGALLSSLTEQVNAEQRQAMQLAVAHRREEIARMVIEGEAGVLEAAWRFKDDHRLQIGELEQRRKVRLDAERQRWIDVLEELE